MARKTVKLSAFANRMAKLDAARAKLDASEAAALVSIHTDDQGMAYASAEQNAYDTMAERGRRNVRASSFAYRKILISTLSLIADCAEDYGYRRAA